MLKKLQCKLREILSAGTGDVEKKAGAAGRPVRKLGNFWFSLVALTGLTVLLWGSPAIEDVTAKVLLIGACILICLLYFLSGRRGKLEGWEVELPTFGLVVVTAAVSALILADESNLPDLGIGTISVLTSLFPFWVLWKLAKVRKQWLVLVVAIPSMAAVWLYLIPLIIEVGLKSGHLWVLLPALSYASLAWAFAGGEFTLRAKQEKKGALWMHTMESLAMLWLFIPFIVFTMLAVNALGFGAIGVTVSGVIVGLIFSGTISEPVRKLIIDLRDLSLPDDRREDTDDESQGAQCDTESIS